MMVHKPERANLEAFIALSLASCAPGHTRGQPRGGFGDGTESIHPAARGSWNDRRRPPAGDNR
jgi:hypothetical protein